MLIQLLIAVIFTILSVSEGQNSQVKPPMPSSPPEVKKTVAAISGTWKGQLIAKLPGAPPASISWTMDCKPVALNAGASCTNGGSASFGEMAESCLLAFDPQGKAVHYMCVTSMGEVHDHRGHWTDPKTIDFEPLQAGMMGQEVTETLKWRFDDDRTIDKISEVRLPDGSVMHFQFKGVRK
jgi:hypothetical protein